VLSDTTLNTNLQLGLKISKRE